MIVSFPKILMAAVETEIINPSDVKSPTLKRCIDDVCSLWILLNEEEINTFIELASNKHRAIKFVAAISGTETTSLDTKFVCVCNRERLKKDAILEVGENFIPIHQLHLLPPYRSQKRLYQRQGLCEFRQTTLQTSHFKKTILNSNVDYATEVTQITF